MRQGRYHLGVPVLTAVLATVAGVLAAGAATAPALAARAAAPAAGPVIKLIPAQDSITVPRYGTQVFVDPGIWVASLNSALRIDVRRASYTEPVTAAQVVTAPGGATGHRPLPDWTVAGWDGLRNFARLTVRNHAGRVVGSASLTFCPDTYDPERAGPGSAPTSPFPQQCNGGDPFTLGTVWGIARGWAADPAENPSVTYNLGLGTYRVTETISPAYTRFFHIPARDASATVSMQVVTGQGCCLAARAAAPAPRRALPSLRRVATLSRAPAGALPDLVALPSWGISTSSINKGRADYLNFAATVWVGGNSPLDVEGFRLGGSPTMQAYQYFWRDGRIVGRMRAGTMGFDPQPGHSHWHFQQFARYQLLSATRKVVVRSEKVGFCIAPTDAVDLLLPRASWSPFSIGLAGQCGSPTALWVQEMMPVGWGDTYNQSKAGQAFDITRVPNGTYYIEIIANPEHVLHEVTESNDVSLRKVILSGTPGHRRVRVPAWHGIDPEN